MKRARETGDEDAFRLWFVRMHGGWTQRVEPTMGVATGIPDLLILDRQREILPIELKVGYIKDDCGMLHIAREIRPTQVRWHVALWMQGGRSSIVVGVKSDDDWISYRLPRDARMLMDWRNGFPIAVCEPWEF